VKLSGRGWLSCVKVVFANIHIVLRIHINISYLNVQMIHIFTFKTYFATNSLIVLFSLEYLETENSVAASACVSVHPFICMETFGLHWMGFNKMRHLRIV